MDSTGKYSYVKVPGGISWKIRQSWEASFLLRYALWLSQFERNAKRAMPSTLFCDNIHLFYLSPKSSSKAKCQSSKLSDNLVPIAYFSSYARSFLLIPHPFDSFRASLCVHAILVLNPLPLLLVRKMRNKINSTGNGISFPSFFMYCFDVLGLVVNLKRAFTLFRAPLSPWSHLQWRVLSSIIEWFVYMVFAEYFLVRLDSCLFGLAAWCLRSKLASLW